MPSSWVAIKDEIKARAKREALLDVDDYIEVCQRHGLTDRSVREALLGLMDLLGVVVAHELRADEFRDVHHGRTKLLDPNWLTRPMYKLVRDRELATGRANAEFTLADLERVITESEEIDSADYSMERYPYIIDTMVKLDLCFSVGSEEDRYLIPAALSSQGPEVDRSDYDLSFRYEYDLLPEGLVPRLIASAHHRLAQRRTAVAERCGVGGRRLSGVRTS